VRGQRSQPGQTRVAPNGYHYTRTPDRGWQLTGRLIAEKKLGRLLRPDERVRYKDNDRNNLSPDNILVTVKVPVSGSTKRARLEAKIAELQAQLEELDAEV
jgi:hypothetical protein